MQNNLSQKLAQQIWAIANQLRGNMDASKFKDYILGIIFYRYLSSRTESYMDDLLKEDGVTYREALADPDLADSVKDWAIDALGYLITPDDLFDTMVQNIKEGKFTIEHLERAISNLTASTIGQKSESAFANLFDAMNLKDADLGKEVSARTKLMSTIILKINDTPFAKDSEAGDVLGTAYMILIGLFQSGAGKKGGEFFTPTCVSTLLAQLTTIGLTEAKNVCDGCAGSGSLLLEVARMLPSQKVGHFYGQEKTGTTYNLLRMNLIMHGVSYDKFTVFNDDTLTHDNFYKNGEAIKFDIQVENPPYSAPNTAADPFYLEDPRYKSAGVLAPKGKADLAFVESMVYHMSDDGRVAVLLPHGVLFRGDAELEIRKYLIDKLNVIDAVIGLAPNMFHGTGIPVCVLYLKKKRNGDSGNVLFIDASKYYEKEGKSNVLRASDIRRIVDCVKDRADIPHFSRKVSLDEIRNNDYNMNIPRYVDSAEKAENWDIYSLVFGGIPEKELNDFSAYFDAFPGLKDELFEKSGASYHLKGDARGIVKNNTAVQEYISQYRSVIADMRGFLKNTLISNINEVDVRNTENILTDELFSKIDGIPLIDKYVAFQSLHDEWEAASADIEIIQAEGFSAVTAIDPNMVSKKENGAEIEIQKGQKGRILPFDLVQKELLSGDLNNLEQKRQELVSMQDTVTEISDNLSESDKEYCYNDDPIYDADKDALSMKVVRAAAKYLAKTYGKTYEFDEDCTEAKIIQLAALDEKIAAMKKEIAKNEGDLDQKTADKIKSLSKEAALFLLELKWIEPFIESISDLADAVVSEFNTDISRLSGKYQVTYEDEDKEINQLENELSGMMRQIKGNDDDNTGLEQLISFLGGAL